MEHFGAVFKLDLTEETRTQLQDKRRRQLPALASYGLCLWRRRSRSRSSNIINNNNTLVGYLTCRGTTSARLIVAVVLRPS